MPQPINTGGFQVSVLPQINWLDPRLMVPDYTKVLTGINQSLDTARQAGAIRDAALARQAVEQTQAGKIAATNAENQFGGANALANLSLLPQSTDLAAARASSALSTLPSQTQADIAANTLRGATDTSALPNIAPAATNKGKQLAADAAKLDFDASQQPVTQGTAANLNTAANIGSQGAVATAAKKNAADAGAIDQTLDQQAIAKVQNQTAQINANLTNDLAQQKAQFVKDHPEWNQDQLQTALLTSKQARDALQGIQDAVKGLPDFYQQKALSDYYTSVAGAARAKTEASLGGLTPAEVTGQARIALDQAQAQREAAKATREEIETLGAAPAGPNQTVAQFAGDIADRTQNPDGSYSWKLRDLKAGQHTPVANPERDANVKRYLDLLNSLGGTPAQASPQAIAPQRIAPANTISLGVPASPLSQVSLSPQPSVSLARPTMAPAPAAPAIPPAAIARLRANPQLAQDFAQAYGVDPRQYLQ